MNQKRFNDDKTKQFDFDYDLCLATLNERLNVFESLLRNPKLFIADYFSHVVNEIDLEVETELVNGDFSDDGYDDHDMGGDGDNIGNLYDSLEPQQASNEKSSKQQAMNMKSSSLASFDKLRPADLNQCRVEMLRELKEYEQQLLDNVKSTMASIDEDKQVFSELKAKLNDLDRNKNELHDLKSSIKELIDLIDIEYNRVRAKYFLNKSFVFLKKVFNTLGALVIFESFYLSDFHIQYLK